MDNYLEQLVTDPVSLTLDRLDAKLFLGLLQSHVEDLKENIAKEKLILNESSGVELTMRLNNYDSLARTLNMRLSLLNYLAKAVQKQYYICMVGGEIFGKGGWSKDSALKEAQDWLDDAEMSATLDDAYPCTEEFYFNWIGGKEIKGFNLKDGFIEIGDNTSLGKLGKTRYFHIVVENSKTNQKMVFYREIKNGYFFNHHYILSGMFDVTDDWHLLNWTEFNKADYEQLKLTANQYALKYTD